MSFQTGEHYVNLYQSLSQPCWMPILAAAKEECKLNPDEVDGHFLAMELYLCYIKEKAKPAVANCSKTPLAFKTCIANYDDKAYDDFMTMFGQVRFLCDFYNSIHPDISVEKITKASWSTVNIDYILFSLCRQ